MTYKTDKRKADLFEEKYEAWGPNTFCCLVLVAPGSHRALRNGVM
jgi:hypothetical protein